MPNPFKPGFNRPPSVFVGRADLLRSGAELVDAVAEGDTVRPVVIVGTRGVGKTTALGEIATAAAQERGWPALRLEAKPGVAFLPELVAHAKAMRELLEQRRGKPKARLQAAQASIAVLGVGGGFGYTRAPEAQVESTQAVDTALVEAAEAAREAGAGFVLLVDELQFADRSEVAIFAAVLQQHIPDQWPVAVVLAGLPAIRDKDRMVTYLERAEWYELGLLDPYETVQALVETAREGGKTMEPDAAEHLAREAGGYPFAVQVFGHHVWRIASKAPSITFEHALAAVPAANADLSAGLYAARWNDASPKEQEYLLALARLRAAAPHDRIDGRAVSKGMGTTTAKTAYLRDRLEKKGTLYSESGNLQLIVPGMAEWITLRHAR